MTTMTSLERYRAMLDGRPVDHLPRVPILMQFAARHIGADVALPAPTVDPETVPPLWRTQIRALLPISGYAATALRMGARHDEGPRSPRYHRRHGRE